MLDHFAALISRAEQEQRGTTLREGIYAVAATEAMVQLAQTARKVRLASLL